MSINYILHNSRLHCLFFAATLFLALFVVPAESRTVQIVADDDDQTFYFVVWQRSGEKVAFLLSEHPSVRQSGEKLFVATANAELELPMHAVTRFTLTDKLGEGQSANSSYYDANDDGHVTIVDVALLISRLGSSATPQHIKEAADAVLRIK